MWCEWEVKLQISQSTGSAHRGLLPSLLHTHVSDGSGTGGLARGTSLCDDVGGPVCR